MTQNFQCTNEEDFFGNKFNTKSDNLIIFKISDDKFICMTRNEVKMIVKEYTKQPAIIQSQHPNNFKRGEEDRENKLNPDNYFYKIPHTGMWIDYTFKKMYDEKINTMKLVKMPNDVVLMRSVPGIVSGMHDYKTSYYKVEKLPRSELFQEERKDFFNIDRKIDEVELSEEEIKEMERDALEVRIPCENIKELSFSPDGKSIVTLNSTRMLTVWDVETREKTHTYQMGYARNNDYAVYGRIPIWSKDGSYIAVSDTDDFKRETYLNRITLLKPNLSYIKSIELKMEITSFNISPDGKYIACGGQNGLVQIYSPERTKKIDSFKLNAPIRSIQFSKDNKYLVFYITYSVYIWDIERKSYDQIVNSENLIDTCISPDRKQLACIDMNYNLIIWDIFSKEHVKIHFNQYYTDCLYLDNTQLLLFGNQCIIYNVETKSTKILAVGNFSRFTVSKNNLALLRENEIIIKNIE